MFFLTFFPLKRKLLFLTGPQDKTNRVREKKLLRNVSYQVTIKFTEELRIQICIRS